MNVEIEGRALLYPVLLAVLLYYSESNPTIANALRLFVLAYVLYKGCNPAAFPREQGDNHCPQRG